MRNSTRPDSTVFLVVLALAGCSGFAGGAQPETALEALRNATYRDVLPQPVTLADGRYEGCWKSP